MLPEVLRDHNLTWIRPARATVGDDNPDAIYAAVGKALSSWEYVEIALTWLFHAVAEADGWGTTPAFGLIFNSERKRDLLKSVASEYFGDKNTPELAKDVYELLTNYKVAADRRNDIAHAVAVIVVKEGEHGVNEGWYLTPPEHALKKLIPDLREPKFGSSYAWTGQQVSELAANFLLLARTIDSVATELDPEQKSRRLTVSVLPGFSKATPGAPSLGRIVRTSSK
ncbi:hypothetical protein ASE82_11690 [Sphingomonas sp. Leaf230]|uniref:hypothetical protein n=1 Tax=Sphingomonas sp. Leaf230 TaxID=1735694 RepID=UPI000713F173|nr:hypothetical protein [Sphingomonas sp. Leaf230]KQN01937.1 hypothetical protein ASE82_11690 [Sphingomonas sp. Leaf230]